MLQEAIFIKYNNQVSHFKATITYQILMTPILCDLFL